MPVLLVLNPGSSSIKWATFSNSAESLIGNFAAIDHGQVALGKGIGVFEQLLSSTAGCDICAVIVRVVHGGSEFLQPIEVSYDNIGKLKALDSLAPLHNQVAMELIESWRQYDQSVRIFAAFDTQFFTELPEVAQTYGLPLDLIKQYQLRRYGFHGFAHQDMLRHWYAKNPHRQNFSLVTAQLGSGCSMTAIRDGKPVDTSMGFTPNEGLLMRTRSGDVDPGLLAWLQKQEGWSPEDTDKLLNQESGWRGLSGGVDNMAELFTSDHPQCHLAFELFRYRFQKTLGAYFAILGGLDGIVLSGGVAEHNPALCQELLLGLSHLGVELHAESANSNLPIELSSMTSKVQCWVVASDEAAMMLLAVQQHFPNEFSNQPVAD